MDAKYFSEIFKVLPTPGIILKPDYPDFTIVEVNDAYLKIRDLSKEALLGKKFFETSDNNPYYDAPEWRESLHRVMSSKKLDRVSIKQFVDFQESEIKVKFFEVEHVPLLDEKGEVSLILRSITDMTTAVEATERSKEAMDHLISKEKFLNETQRVAISGSWEVDLTFNKVTWSEVLKEIYEVGGDFEPRMMNLIDFYKESKDRETVTKLFDDAIYNGEVFDVELRIVTAKGNERLVRTIGKPELREGKCIRIYGITQDITERKITELELDESRNRFHSLLHSVEGMVWEAEASDFQLTFISEQAERILGYSKEEIFAKPTFLFDIVHPDDLEVTFDYFNKKSKQLGVYDLEYRLKRADGRYLWFKSHVSVIKQDGKSNILRGLLIDITANKRMGEIDYLERKILELTAIDTVSLKQVLTEYVLGLEAIFPKMQCSILRVQHNRLFSWAAPSLPQEYLNSIEGIRIGKSIGSCGAAAFLKEQVIVADIADDFRWAAHRDVALKSNLRACWSNPIINAKGVVIATFGIYFDEPKAPDEDEVAVIMRGTALIRIILENRLNADVLVETTELMNQSQALAQFGTWVWDVKHDEVSWSDSLYQIYGFDEEKFKPTFESYLNILHKEDQERVSAGIGKVLSTKKVHQFEERIVRPDGEIRWLKSWALPKLDAKGDVAKLLGASIDITEKRRTQEELMASELRLRSLVETQTNYVVRMDFMGNYTYCNNKYKEDFDWIYNGEEIVGQKAIKSVFDYHYQRLFDVGEQCISNPNVVFKEEIDKPAKDGSIKYTLWHFVCLTDSKGLPLEMQGTGIDITELKLAERQLNLSNERYHYVNKATNDAIYDWDIINDHIEWGDGYQRLFGYDLKESPFPLKKWSAWIHPEDYDHVAQGLDKALMQVGLQHWVSEYRYLGANQEYSHIVEIGYIVRDAKGKAIRMIGVLRDISEHKAAELERKELNRQLQQNLQEMLAANTELAESRQRYRDLFHFSPQPMYVYEVDSLMFVDVNEAAIQFYGYSREEFLSMDITKIRLEEDVAVLLEELKIGVQKGVTYHGVFRHIKKNGELVHVDIQSNAIRFNDKATNLVLAKNITERLNYLNAVEHQNQTLKEISWMQSHVVRAPLSKLMSLIDLMNLIDHLPEKEKNLLYYMKESAIELDQIIREISSKTERSLK